MAWTITIGGVEYQNYSSPPIATTAKNGTPDTLSFSLSAPSLDAFPLPTTGQEVEFLDGATSIFSGKIVKVAHDSPSVSMLGIKVDCQDFSTGLKKGSPIAEIFTDMTVEDIFTYLKANYAQFAPFSIAGVVCTEVIPRLFLDHLTGLEVMRKIAEQVGYDFYISGARVIYFYDPVIREIKLAVTDTDGGQIGSSMKITEDATKIVNSIMVVGDEYDGTEIVSETFTANGTQTEFPLAGRYSEPAVTVAGVPQSVGLQNLGDPLNYDCLFDYQTKKITFREDNKPTNGQSVVFSGRLKIPLFAVVTDDSSIEKYGEIFQKIKDTSLKTQDAVNQYALSKLKQDSDNLFSCVFSTYKTGVRAGDRVQAQSARHGFTKIFVVQTTSTSIYNPNATGGAPKFRTDLTLADSEEVSLLSMMARLFNEKNRTSSGGEQMEIIKSLREKGVLTDTFEISEGAEVAEVLLGTDLVEYRDDPENIVWVVGDYIPSGLMDNKRNLGVGTTPCVY